MKIYLAALLFSECGTVTRHLVAGTDEEAATQNLINMYVAEMEDTRTLEIEGLLNPRQSLEDEIQGGTIRIVVFDLSLGEDTDPVSDDLIDLTA